MVLLADKGRGVVVLVAVFPVRSIPAVKVPTLTAPPVTAVLAAGVL